MSPNVPAGHYALGGTWTASPENITAGAKATLDLNFHAKKVFLVLAGSGLVEETLDGKFLRTMKVKGFPTLYTLSSKDTVENGLLHLRFSPGISAYAFTFG